MPQRPNLDLISEAWKLHREETTMSHEDIAEKLGVSWRSVANYLNSKWLAARNLGHLAFPEQELQIPRSRLENEAWGLCRRGNHDWMAHERYEWHAYRKSKDTKEDRGFGGSLIKTTYEVRTCNFGPHRTERRLYSCIAV